MMFDNVTDRELLAAVIGKRADKAQYLELAELAGAPEGELRAIFGARAAPRLIAAFELGRRGVAARLTRGKRLTSAADVWATYKARLALSPVEEFWSLALDVRHRLQEETMLAKGSLTGVDVHPRDVFRPLIRAGAAAVIFVHNHPSGDPSPSQQDIELTRKLRETGGICGIAVLDHVIVGAEGYSSIMERNWT